MGTTTHAVRFRHAPPSSERVMVPHNSLSAGVFRGQSVVLMVTELMSARRIARTVEARGAAQRVAISGQHKLLRGGRESGEAHMRVWGRLS